MEDKSDAVALAREEELKLPTLAVNNQETFGKRHW